MGHSDTPRWLQSALGALRHDPKKTGALVVLLAALGVMAMRTFGPGRNTPAPASASVSAGSSNVAGPGSRDSSASRGTSANGAPAQSSRLGSGNPHLQKWAESPILPITRNLFAIRLEYFPVERPRIGTAVKVQAGDGFWVKLEKSLSHQADQRDKRENQIANYRAEAARLKLQSTMMGPQPKALVNGELVGEGDVVASFRVLKIEARRIIIEREGIRLEIQMK